MIVPAISRPRIQGKAGMPKLYDTLFQSTGFKPTASFRMRASSDERGEGIGWWGVSSNDSDQPCEQERTRRASERV